MKYPCIRSFRDYHDGYCALDEIRERNPSSKMNRSKDFFVSGDYKFVFYIGKQTKKVKEMIKKLDKQAKKEDKELWGNF